MRDGRCTMKVVSSSLVDALRRSHDDDVPLRLTDPLRSRLTPRACWATAIIIMIDHHSFFYHLPRASSSRGRSHTSSHTRTLIDVIVGSGPVDGGSGRAPL